MVLPRREKFMVNKHTNSTNEAEIKYEHLSEAMGKATASDEVIAITIKFPIRFFVFNSGSNLKNGK